MVKGVGVIAGGPFGCAKADADDFINGYMLPVLIATGSCMTGPPSNLDIFLAKAAAKAASGGIDSLQNLSHQKIYIFHGYNNAVVAKSATDATAAGRGAIDIPAWRVRYRLQCRRPVTSDAGLTRK